MHRIVYLSHASATLSPAAIEDLRRTSEANNAAAGVTGLLLYDGRRFIQAIEGRQETVRPLMTRIAADTRHSSIAMMFDAEVARREFGDWSLAYRPIARGRDAAHVVRDTIALVGDVAEPSLRAAFVGFAALGRR